MDSLSQTFYKRWYNPSKSYLSQGTILKEVTAFSFQSLFINNFHLFKFKQKLKELICDIYKLCKFNQIILYDLYYAAGVNLLNSYV